MNIDKILSFDFWGDFGMYRRPYTTTSPLTFPFPTRTAITGLIASILGMERDSYYEEFGKESCKIGIQLLSPVKKMSMGLNLIDTKKGLYLWDITENPRTQILYEILKDVSSRIYLWLRNENLYSDLKRRLKAHTSVYTPYMGMGQFLANFKFVNEHTSISVKEGKNDSIITVAPESYGIRPKAGHRIGRINMPMFMDKDRNCEYGTLVYDGCSSSNNTEHALMISRGEFFELDGNTNIVLL